ncbi:MULTISPECIES: 3'-5' exonuclease [Clostridium]|uniref:3'-5' exonuclease n=1 Tax=Clostridium TaxID=1485 RepID=UPI001899D62A|nr:MULTISPECIES: 3'-5' exonuclease [Clostridium]MDB2124449.1 3'-5' exonuclease [Clostridium paraputrificum]MDU1584639.1 3'-5' exonuclease [Clostridium sp.]MDU1978609.1 3'-5' exonuclease [Clostridium sp.]MDU1994099.1 3'-5' exonuclease [Clostridium sp.]MDU6048687.1 3'-5' exonuclease [Clostridium sp.]
MKLLIFDTETTSIKPGHICQLSYITIDASTKPQQTIGKNFFFTVDEMDPAAEAVHGFSLEKLYDLSNGQYIEDLIEEFINDFSEADFVIGHNVNFDVRFLKLELEAMGIDYEPKNMFCTMQYYRDICKLLRPSGDYKNPKLEEVINFLGITKDQISSKADELFQGSGDYHDARFDTAATYLLIIEGLKKGYIPRGYFSKKLLN